MDALDALRIQIEWGADEALGAAPVDRFALSAPPLGASAALAAAATVRKASQPQASMAAAPVRSAPGAPPPARRAEEIANTCRTPDELRDALLRYEGCSLSVTATNLVFSDGNPNADLMFVGEGPGAEEDRAGKPFVGPSGQLLDRMLGSIGLTREHVLITNLIFWRLPGNRNPTDDEVLICLPFLLRHIALVRPRHLVLLGALAARAVLNETTGIRRLRGKVKDVTLPGLDTPITVLPMLHPAYLLRAPSAKRHAWADMRMLSRLRTATLTNT